MSQNVEDANTGINEAFLEVRKRFENLKDAVIYLNHREIPSSSMRVQPILNLSFFIKNTRSYRSEVALTSKIDSKTSMNDLTHDVLVGYLWLNPKEESIVEKYELIESDDVTDSIRDSVSVENNELNQLSQ